ncbi:hypothetical protein ACH492_28110 [Streptomyces sp. NPDC019443]
MTSSRRSARTSAERLLPPETEVKAYQAAGPQPRFLEHVDRLGR